MKQSKAISMLAKGLSNTVLQTFEYGYKGVISISYQHMPLLLNNTMFTAYVNNIFVLLCKVEITPINTTMHSTCFVTPKEVVIKTKFPP